MPLSFNLSALQRFRRHRRPLGWIVAALIAVSLAGVLWQCLATGQLQLIGSATADTANHATMPGDIPCATCTAGSDWRSLDEGTSALPTNLKPAFVLTLVVVSTLLALNLPKSVPIPPLPLLPRRPRTLKFCVLRI